MTTYTETTAQEKLSSLSDWSFNNEGIEKTFQFKDFIEAFGFMTQVAILAEKANHHPEWSNVYRTVEVVLTTHDVGGISNADIALATFMDAVA